MISDKYSEYKNSVSLVWSFNSENITLKERFGVSDLPTIILFRSGTVINFIVGIKPKSELYQSLEILLNN